MKWIYYNNIERFFHVQILSLIRLFWTNFSLIRSNFERTSVWSEAISSALQSDQRQFRSHFSLIRGGFERTLVWSGDDIRAHNSLTRGNFRAHSKRTRSLERTLVWSEVKPVWLGLIRGQFCLERSDQRPFRSRPQPGNSSRLCFKIDYFVIHYF